MIVQGSVKFWLPWKYPKPLTPSTPLYGSNSLPSVMKKNPQHIKTCPQLWHSVPGHDPREVLKCNRKCAGLSAWTCVILGKRWTCAIGLVLSWGTAGHARLDWCCPGESLDMWDLCYFGETLDMRKPQMSGSQRPECELFPSVPHLSF